MARERTRTSPRVRAEIARKLHADGARYDGEAIPSRFWEWLVSAGLISWGLLLVAGPLLLLLLPLGLNYTAQWLAAAGWVLLLTLAGVALGIAVTWVARAVRGPRTAPVVPLSEVAQFAGLSCGALLLWGILVGGVPHAVLLVASVLLSLLRWASGVTAVLAELKVPLFVKCCEVLSYTLIVFGLVSILLLWQNPLDLPQQSVEVLRSLGTVGWVVGFGLGLPYKHWKMQDQAARASER